MKPNGYWTADRCVERARGFSRITDWQRECPGSFDASRHNGSYDDCVAHMRRRRRRGSITKDSCRADALKYSLRSKWKASSHAMYLFAKNNGLLDEFTAHMDFPVAPDGYWTFQRCVAQASKFRSRKAWARGHNKSYDAALRHGFLDRVATAVDMKRKDRGQAQRAFAASLREILPRDVDLREEVRGLAGGRTRVDMAFYRDGVPFLAVEYQGAYWHSEAAGKGRHSHRDRMATLRENGIRLITVHEADADNPVVMGMIRSALGIVGRKFRASGCRLVPVDNMAASRFYDINHIQGGGISGKEQTNLGLEYGGSLVACMTFVRAVDRHTGSGNYDWCLHRFATVMGHRVHGAASRLFKRFCDTHPGESVVSYCDLQFFDGGVYRVLGFEHVRDNPPDYSWVIGNAVIAKHEAQRKFLPKLLGEGFDSTLSERQNMERAGFSRVWDCGKAVYAYRSEELAKAA